MGAEDWINAEAVRSDYRKFRESEGGRVTCYTCAATSAIGVLITVLVLLGTSFQKLESKEFGVAYNTVQRSLAKDVKVDGLHTGSPFFRFIVYPSTFITVNMPEDLKHADDATCVSKDGLVVKTEVSFQYTVDKAHIIKSMAEYREFKVFNEMVKAAGVSAVHHGCGEFPIQDFQGKRAAVQARMLEFFKQKIEPSEDGSSPGLYSRAVDLQLRNVQLPTAYASAVSNKQSAEEDIELAKNQRTQSLTAANTQLLTARRTGEKTLDNARNSANIRRKEAEYKANATLLEYQTEAQTYATIKNDLQLTSEGFLAYMGNRAIESQKNPNLRVLEPATLSYREEL